MSHTPPPDAGHAVYTPSFLRIYDPLVLGFFGRFVWRCPTRRLVDHYASFLGARHLDVGPGTGYFLQGVRPPAAITLLDPSADVLDHCRKRLAHLRPTTVRADVVEALPVAGPFDSAALNYVLHCLPSDGEAKARAVSNVGAVLSDDGVLFGATVLGTPDLHTVVSRPALRANNRRGIFDNLTDDVATIRDVLDTAFRDTSIEVVGSVAVFSARRPRRPRR